MSPSKNIHFNGLNGIRAICALSVVVSHLYLALSSIGINLKSTYSFVLAPYSVTAFFSLSGFLITSLLTQEKEISGTVSIKKFYVRRILRIWPLYFAYIFLALLADRFIFHVTDFSSAGYYVLFFANIPYACNYARVSTVVPILLLSHFWSLGVEEQFYAFYPWLIKRLKNLLLVLVGMLTIMLLAKIITHYWSAKTGNPLWYAYVECTPFEAMAIGGLGAWFYKKHQALAQKIVAIKWIQVVVTAILLLVLADKVRFLNPFSHMVMAMVTVMVIGYAHLLKNPFINLDNKYLDALGKMSYGIYVYHPLVLALAALVIKNMDIGVGYKVSAFFIMVIGCTIGLAYLSYHYFEKYFLQMKYKYAVVPSKD